MSTNTLRIDNQQVTLIDSGRIFTRLHTDGHCSLVGLLDVPADMPTEQVIPAVVAAAPGGLFLAAHDAREPLLGHDMREPSQDELSELDANALIRTLKWKRSPRMDGCELFLRQSALTHHDEKRRWVIAAGAAASALSTLPVHGLYELRGDDNPAMISEEPHAGMNTGQLLREVLWGPDGRFGLGTSMQVKFYERWIIGERTRNGRRDEGFARYMAIMDKLPPFPLAYTKEQIIERSLQTEQFVLAEIDELEAQYGESTPVPGQS
ncbi:hypothetical protein [Polaromonas sp.]|uniref:hypothetical protein n=1 Tax=Polaromonas sp. TaxID=1869339 RepID=UPI00352B178D